MTLPKKVREAGERAEAELKALQEGNQPDTGDSDPPNTGGEGNDPPPEPTGDEPTPGPGEKDEIDWKEEHGRLTHKFNVLKGKFDSENPVLKAENARLKETLTSLEQRMEQIESGSPTPPTPTPAPAGTGTPDDVPESVKELYGEDLISFINRRAKAAADEAVAPLAESVRSQQETSLQQREDEYIRRLDEAHSDWRQINELEKFLNFLGEYVDEYGCERQEIINRAQADLNPAPTIAQLTIFKERHAPGKQEQESLRNSETPPDSGATATPDEPDGPQLKESEIQKFYRDAAAGRFRGREDEFNRRERQIQEAAEAGTIIMDVTGGRAIFTNVPGG